MILVILVILVILMMLVILVILLIYDPCDPCQFQSLVSTTEPWQELRGGSERRHLFENTLRSDRAEKKRKNTF